MVELITRLKQRGYRVASLKHCHDGFDLDVEGKDTWKHKQAGADTTMMVGPELVGLLVNQPMRLSLAELCKRFTPEADIALAEGFSWEAVPKILVDSRATFAEEKVADDQYLIALVNPYEASNLPQFEFTEASMDALAQWVEERFLKANLRS